MKARRHVRLPSFPLRIVAVLLLYLALPRHAWADEGCRLVADGSGTGDDNGHGTHVCGIVSATANNGVGVVGTSYNATVIPVRVLDEEGIGSTVTVARGVDYAVGLKTSGAVASLRVINLSLGGDDDPLLAQAVSNATDKSILCVCAAGNDASMAASYPSDYEDALSVMALGTDVGGLGPEEYAPPTMGTIDTSGLKLGAYYASPGSERRVSETEEMLASFSCQRLPPEAVNGTLLSREEVYQRLHAEACGADDSPPGRPCFMRTSYWRTNGRASGSIIDYGR